MPESADPDAPFRGPLFIVGMPRSGTKLLRGLLNGHPQVGIPAAETEFLPDWARRWPSFGDLSDRAVFQRFYDEVTGSAYFVYLEEEQGRRVEADAWYRACQGFGLAEVFEALIRLDAEVESSGLWGDKSPGYIRHIPLLDRLWPRSRVIHIIRDCRDYCLSIQKAWGKDPLRAAQRWADRVGTARGDGRKLGPERYLELRYEDLLQDPAELLRRCCAFLDLDYRPGMTTLTRPTENIGDTAGQSRIVQTNTEKWREMDEGLRRRIEAIAAEELRATGYPVEHEGPTRRLSPIRMAAGQVLDGLNLVRSDADQRGWLGAARFRLRLFRESGTRESLGRG